MAKCTNSTTSGQTYLQTYILTYLLTDSRILRIDEYNFKIKKKYSKKNRLQHTKETNKDVLSC